MITKRDYEARNNERWSTSLLFTDGTDPIDLTGTEWAMHLRRVPRGLLELELSTTNGRLFLSSTLGALVIEVVEADVRYLSGVYFYDLKETIADRVYQAGMITVVNGETREGDIYATA